MSENAPIFGENDTNMQEERGYQKVHSKSIIVGLLVGTVVTALFMSPTSRSFETPGPKLLMSSKVNMKNMKKVGTSIKYKRERQDGMDIDITERNECWCWRTSDGIECICF